MKGLVVVMTCHKISNTIILCHARSDKNKTYSDTIFCIEKYAKPRKTATKSFNEQFYANGFIVSKEV